MLPVNMRRVLLTEESFRRSLRKRGHANMQGILAVIVEPDGSTSVIMEGDWAWGSQPAEHSASPSVGGKQLCLLTHTHAASCSHGQGACLIRVFIPRG
jgi:hypothetical protein